METNSTPLAEALMEVQKKPNMSAEDFVRALERAKMTPEERRIADAQKLGEAVGSIVANLLILFIAPTFIWAALVYLVGVQVGWLQVFGAYLIFNFLKNFTISAVKKGQSKN